MEPRNPERLENWEEGAAPHTGESYGLRQRGCIRTHGVQTCALRIPGEPSRQKLAVASAA